MLKSLSFKINLLIVIVVTLVTCCLGGYDYVRDSKKRIEHIEDELLATSIRLQKSLVPSLWDLNSEDIDSLLRAEMFDPNILAISVHEKFTEKTIARLGRNQSWEVVNQQGDPSSLQVFRSKSMEITKEENILGHLEIYVTNRFIRAETQASLMRFLFKIAILLLIEVVILVTIIQRVVVLPISRLKDAFSDAKRQGQTTSNQLDTMRHDEIGQLAQAFINMQDHISTLFSERDDRIAELESTKKTLQAREEALEKFSQRLAIHVEQTPLGVIEWDLDFNVVQWNRAAEKIFGYTCDEAIGQHGPELIVPESARKHVEPVWRDLLANSGGTRSTNLNTAKDGKTLTCEWYNTTLVDKEGVVIGVASLIQDITDQKIVKETFQTVVKSTVGKTGKEFFDNLCVQLCALFKSEHAMVGELINPTTVNAIAMLVDGKPIKNFSYQLPGTPCANVAADGFCHYPENITSLFPEDQDLQNIGAVGYVGTPLRDHTGSATGVLCVLSKKKMTLPEGAEDLMNIVAARTSAEIVRTQEERNKNKLERRLKQAQKMEAIGTLAGGIAHDFNNILGAILGYADMAKEDAPPGTQFEKDLDKVLIAANRAKDLVKQILAFSRQAQIERLPIKIQPLIKEGLRMLRSSIPTTISIRQDIDPKSGVILADPTQIHQILMNLCTNAYQAMDETGGGLSVSLKTTLVGTDQQNTLVIPPGEYIELTVSDTGAGIRPDVIDKIFDPYFTTKELGKGTGMGLAIIHGIIIDYGGTITVESKLGEGTAFHVYLPVIEKDTLPDITESEDIQRGKERVLFIDDEKLLAEMGKDMLERLGYHVTVRRNSIEALTTFQNTPDEFDVVITDQTMPNLTGSDLARRMMQIRPDIPIILCTGYSNLIDEHSAKALGIREFALKPLAKKTIAKLVRKVLDVNDV